MKYFIVDAFTDSLFSGNQAGVCILDSSIEEDLMQNIAAENNLSETAFVHKTDTSYNLRWFTPTTEIDLCGHATLASAYVLSEFISKNEKIFHFTTKSGSLYVEKKDGLYEMDFPARKPQSADLASFPFGNALGVTVLEVHKSRDLLLLLENEASVKSFVPNFEFLKQFVDTFGVIVTAKGDNIDFVSRFFAPNAGIMEDPVTGSSHSTLIPFWNERLKKDTMIAHQLSKRGGTLYCTYLKDRVKIAGKAKLYLSGEIKL